MLPISHNKVDSKHIMLEYQSVKQVFEKKYYKKFNRLLIVFALIILVILFLPWTQNVKGKGKVTTLKPSQRPQSIQSQIPGRIEAWYVQEGDYVSKGDTILRISEIKSDYFDQNLLERTGDQIEVKEESVGAYGNKMKALDRRINALENEQRLKLQQTENKLRQDLLKVKSDSVELQAIKLNLNIAQRQYDRAKILQDEGLKAVKDLEEKHIKLQELQAKSMAQENKLLASKNHVMNTQMELSVLTASYADKISKAQSDKFTAQSSQLDTQAQVSKLKNSYSNYKKRNELLYITAPQDGYITQAIKGGLGEAFKEGEKLISIMPAVYDLAVETYVEPIDLPLIHIGEKVRIQFDGWPAIIFSGWPNVSYGTYSGEIVAIDRLISENGKYRVLLAPDRTEEPWPDAIRVGSGTHSIALLEDVPIWYELWRQLNGFPPNFYKPENKEITKK